MFNLKLFFMQLKNKLDENYLGGEYYLKEYNFFGKIFKRKLLYPNTPACVEYYELENGTCTVEEFILKQYNKMQAKIFKNLELLEIRGN